MTQTKHDSPFSADKNPVANAAWREGYRGGRTDALKESIAELTELLEREAEHAKVGALVDATMKASSGSAMTARDSLLSALRSRKLLALAALVERAPDDTDFAAATSELFQALEAAVDTYAIEAGEMAEGDGT